MQQNSITDSSPGIAAWYQTRNTVQIIGKTFVGLASLLSIATTYAAFGLKATPRIIIRSQPHLQSALSLQVL